MSTFYSTECDVSFIQHVTNTHLENVSSPSTFGSEGRWVGFKTLLRPVEIVPPTLTRFLFVTVPLHIWIVIVNDRLASQLTAPLSVAYPPVRFSN